MDLFERFLNSAYRFLAARPRSEKEVRDNLLRKSARKKSAKSQIDPQTLEKVIAYLKEKRFVDDHEFTKWWIQQRTTSSPRGLRLIKMELLQKGVERDIIDEVSSIIHSASSGQVSSEIEMIRKLIEKRLPRLRNLPLKEQKEKLWQFLARRGFDSDDIKESIDEKLTAGV